MKIDRFLFPFFAATAVLFSTAHGDPLQMAKIPGGILQREEGKPVTIAPFHLATTELTFGEWTAVRTWALEHGYDFGPGSGETADYPASNVTWYDAVKFCNAASELAGLKPVYFISAAKKEVYRKGILDLPEDCSDPDANGYRLPTEWEWEFACRAGTDTDYWYGTSSAPLPTNPYAWHTGAGTRGEEVSPHPVGLKKPNPYGLFDMNGNVAEWCWSLYWNKANWRVQRGGSVALDNNVTSGFRSPVPPYYRIYDAGLRLAGPAAACPPLHEVITAKGLPAPVAKSTFKPSYDGADPAAVAAKLVSLLDPAEPQAAKIAALQKQGKAQEALAAFRDDFVQRLRSAPRYKGFGPTVPKGAEKIAQMFTEDEVFATVSKTDFDNLDTKGRAAPNSYLVPVTWDFGMGFSAFAEKWFKVLQKLTLTLPADTPAETLFPARAVANMAIYAATDEITKLIKDPRDCVGNQQIAVAESLVYMARTLPLMREAPAWEALGIERLRTGALARFILPDGGDLEQSFNYNNGLFDSAVSISELFEAGKKPDWVLRLGDAAIARRRMFSALRHASGALPSVGNNSYGRDVSERWGEKYPAPDPLFEQITDRLLDGGKRNLPAPAFTSIAFPYSGYYMMRNGWEPTSSTLFFKSSRPGAGHNHPDNNAIDLCAYGRHLLVGREAPPYQPLHLPDNQKKDFLWVCEYKGEGAPRVANNLLIDGCGQESGVSAKGYATTIPGQSWFTSDEFDFVQGTWTRAFQSGAHLSLEEIKTYAAQYGASKDELAAQLAAAEKLNAQPEDHFKGTHTRQVIYLRKVNAWIVTDRARREDGKPAKELTQLWNFPSPLLGKNRGYGSKFKGSPLSPGFGKEQVQPDEAAGQVITHNPENANLAILHAVPGGVKYQTFFGDKYPWRGWANSSPSMVSGYVPAVDLHVTFAAGAPAVTVLVPIPQGKSFQDRVVSFEKKVEKNVTSIRLRFTDGTTVDYTVSPEPQELNAGPARDNTTALLAMTKEGKTSGLAISRSGEGDAFTVVGGKVQHGAPITVPAGFSWESTAQGYVPNYQTPNGL